MIELFLACVSAYEIAMFDEVYIEKDHAEVVLQLGPAELSNMFAVGDIGVEYVYCYRLAWGSVEEDEDKRHSELDNEA